MTRDVQEAMLILYGYEQRLADRNSYLLDKIDRALDQLSRNPGKVGVPGRMVRSALGNAATVLKNRKKNVHYEDQYDFGETIFSISDESAYANIEVQDFLNNSTLSSRDREILLYLLEDKSAEDIAVDKGISINLARVHISRARAKARKLWGVA